MERRLITFLFCDLVDSTSLFERLDPEDVREVQNTVRGMFRRLAATHDGYVAEYVGDGVVMYFGYPRAQEDDPERAIRCALAIGRQVASIHRAMNLHVPLSVRTAIHTSEAALGPLNPDDDWRWAAYGIATSIAGRLQKEAPPGGVVVTDVTWNLVRSRFSGRSLGALALAGLSQPIRAWQIDGEPPAGEWDDLPNTSAVLVGRERERALLADLWRGAVAGENHFVLLRGEPGMGKSRLTKYWRDTVASTGAAVVVVRATPNGRNDPFHPIAALLTRCFGLRSSGPGDDRLNVLARGVRERGFDDAAAVALIAPVLGIPLDGRYELPDLSPARRRSRLIEVLTSVLVGLCADGPTFLVVEDLHWADESTLELLERVVVAFPPIGVLGVLTARLDLDPMWGHRSGMRSVILDRLTSSESAAIARAVALGKALPERALRQILSRSEGVPLFVEELTRSVIESGMLRERSASWEIVEPGTELIPMAVHAPLIARIDRLGSARSTAQLAAAIGGEFSFGLLSAVSDRDESTVRQDLRRLEESGLAWELGESDPDVFVFKHALIRDAAYELLSRRQRQAYHSRIAAALRRDATARNDLVALHLTNAGEHEDAIAFWEAAGHDALRGTAVFEASGHFRRAIECLTMLPAGPERDLRELDLQDLLAPTLFSVYGWASTEAEQACRRARDLAVTLGRHDRLYRPLWGLWSGHFLRGELGPALKAAEAVHVMAQESGDATQQVTSRHAISYTRMFRGEFEVALKEADAGLALLDPTQEKALADEFQLSSGVCLRQSRAQSLWMLGRITGADEEAERMLRLARELDHPSNLAGALAFTLHGGAVRHSYTHEMVRLRDIALELRQLSHDEGFFLWTAVADIYLGVIAQAQGERDARRQMKEGLELLTQTRTRVTTVMMNVIVAEALYDVGEDDEALALLDEAEVDGQAREEGFCAPEVWRVRGRFLARQGRQSDAESAYRYALGLAGTQKARSLELRAALDLHDLLDAEGRAAEGRACLTSFFDRALWTVNRPEPARGRSILTRPSLPSATGALHVG